MHEVHPIAEPARQRILDPDVRQPHWMSRLKPYVAPALKTLKFHDVRLLLDDPSMRFVVAPKLLEAGEDLRDIAHTHDPLRLPLQQRFDQFHFRKPGPIAIEDDGSIDRIEKSVHRRA